MLCNYARGIFANRTSSLPRHQFGYIRPGRSNRVFGHEEQAGKSYPELWSGRGLFRMARHSLGLIAITGTPSFVWGDVEKTGPALAVAMLTVLYGYMVKLVTITLAED